MKLSVSKQIALNREFGRSSTKIFTALQDLLLQKLGENKFTWGTLGAHTPLEVEGKTRSDYVAALKKADKADFVDLIKFVKKVKTT